MNIDLSCRYNGEQALGMLYWHGYDVEKAIHDLPNFTPLPEEWTVEDKVELRLSEATTKRIDYGILKCSIRLFFRIPSN